MIFPWATDPKFNDFSMIWNRSEFQRFFKSCGNHGFLHSHSQRGLTVPTVFSNFTTDLIAMRDEFSRDGYIFVLVITQFCVTMKTLVTYWISNPALKYFYVGMISLNGFIFTACNFETDSEEQSSHISSTSEPVDLASFVELWEIIGMLPSFLCEH